MPAESQPHIIERIRRWKFLYPGVPLRHIKWWDHGAPGSPYVGPEDVILPGSPNTDGIIKEIGPGCIVSLEGCNIGYGEEGENYRESWKRRYPFNPLIISPSKKIINPIPIGPIIIEVPAEKKDKAPKLLPWLIEPIKWILDHPAPRGPKY